MVVCAYCGKEKKRPITKEQKDIYGKWLPLCNGCYGKRIMQSRNNPFYGLMKIEIRDIEANQ